MMADFAVGAPSALNPGKQAERGSGGDQSKKITSFFLFSSRLLTVEQIGGAETRRRQRHGKIGHRLIVRNVTKIVIVA